MAFEPERPQKTALAGHDNIRADCRGGGAGAAGIEPELPFALGQYRVVQALKRGGMGVVPGRLPHATQGIMIKGCARTLSLTRTAAIRV